MLPIGKGIRTLPQATGVSQALRARNQKKNPIKKSPGGPGGPNSLEKVSKKSDKSGKSLENVCSGPLRDFFKDFFGISGPGGPERLL